MLAISLIGAALLFAGVVYLARATIQRGRMSDPHAGPKDASEVTLEPRRQSVGFLGLKPNLAGLLMIAVGALMLLLPLLFAGPAP